MSTNLLFSHLHNLVSMRRMPPSVSARIIRQFKLDSLRRRGIQDIAHLESGELEDLWHQEFWDDAQEKYQISYQPKPSRYVIVACYTQIFRGLGYFQAISYEGFESGLKTLDLKGLTLEYNGDLFDADRALEFIGEGDEIVSGYLRQLECWQVGTLLEFALDDQQLIEFHSLYEDLSPESRGLAGASEVLRKKIMNMNAT